MAQPALATRSGMTFDADVAARDPFGAYVADDATAAAAQAVARQRGWSAGAVRRGTLDSARRLLGVAPPPRFLIVDIDGLPIEEVVAGLVEIARLGSAVIALGTVNDVNFFRRIMRSGARDYLVKPVDADTLGEVLVRLEQPGDIGTAAGRVVGFLGARGGVGTTTLAINTAWIMADRLSRRTALVDMDIYAGNIALSLDIEPTRGLREAFDDPERVDEVFLQNAMAKFGKGLHVLATEESFDDTVRMTDDKMLMLTDTMRNNFDMAMLDLPRHFVMREPALFSQVRRSGDRHRADAAVATRRQPVDEAAAGPQPGDEGAPRRQPRAGRSGRDRQGVRDRHRRQAALRVRARHQGLHGRRAKGPSARRGQPQAPDRARAAQALHRARRRAGGAEAGFPQATLRQGLERHGGRFRPQGVAPDTGIASLRATAVERLRAALGPAGLAQASPLELAERANQTLEELVGARADKLSLTEQRQLLRDIVTSLQSERTSAARNADTTAAAGPAAAAAVADHDPLAEITTRSAPDQRNKRELQVKQQVMPMLMQRIDISVASSLGPDELRAQIAEIVEQIIVDLRLQLNASEMKSIVRLLVDDMVGLGPLEPLLDGREHHRHHGQRPEARSTSSARASSS